MREFTAPPAVCVTDVTVDVTGVVAPPVTLPSRLPALLVTVHRAPVAADSSPPEPLQLVVLPDWLASAWLRLAPVSPTASNAAGTTAIR